MIYVAPVAIPRKAKQTFEACESVSDRFNELATKWIEQTAHFSLVSQQTSNINFHKILVLGKAALPLIFQEFARLPIPGWLRALEIMTESDPASEARNYKEAVKCWISWGQENGYLQP